MNASTPSLNVTSIRGDCHKRVKTWVKYYYAFIVNKYSLLRKSFIGDDYLFFTEGK